MKKTVVINVVGLSKRLIGEHTPFLRGFLEQQHHALIQPVLPAVTCSAQATYLTGVQPSEHGIVGNGWYFKEECEVKFWRQSNKLVQAPKIWEKLRQEFPGFSCANLFWWYNMYSAVDFSVTPRPNYLADGRKIPDIYSHPSLLRDRLQQELGTFPLFHFWGPKTSIASSQWIADAALLTDKWYNPTLSLVYLPHLDYNIQRHGLNFEVLKTDLAEIDSVVKQVADHFQKQNANIVLLSEYGITNVNHPIHLNRILRQHGYLALRVERGLEVLDAGASKAFAVADHQIAHIYVNDVAVKDEVAALLKEVSGVDKVLLGKDLKAAGLDHERAGDFVVVADRNSWFTYYFWEEDTKAPDFARMVDIHKKPGYDPVEMFTDPSDPFVVPKILWKLVKKKMGFRTVMDVIPLKAELVKGSHGRIPEDEQDWPVLLHNASAVDKMGKTVRATEVFRILEEIIKQSNHE